MSKIIHIAGFKGGTGKTTIAIHLSSYIHYKLKKKVVLMGFDIQKEISLLNPNLPYSVEEFKPDQITEFQSSITKTETADYVVVDFPGGFKFDLLPLHTSVDMVIVPSDLSRLDIIKTAAFYKTVFGILPKASEKLFLLPNFKIPNQTKTDFESIKQALNKLGIDNVTPAIGYTKTIQQFTEAVFKDKIFYLCRPAFQFLLEKV